MIENNSVETLKILEISYIELKFKNIRDFYKMIVVQ